MPYTKLYLLITLSAVLTPIYRILVNARIPILALETWLVLAVMIVIAVVLGLALRLSGQRLRLVLLAAILFVHLDLAGIYGGLNAGTVSRGGILLLSFGVIYTCLWVIRRYAVRVAAAYFVVVGLAVVATEPLPRLALKTSAPASPPTRLDTVSATAPPLVIHLLFDALLAPSAIERGIEGGDAVYGAMQRLAEHHGFRVFERAFSRHHGTAASIPNLMDAEYREEDTELSFKPRYEIEENAYFDDYAAQGYVIKVNQTGFIDYCANKNVSSCAEFTSYTPVWLIANELYGGDNADTFSAVTARTFDFLLTLLGLHAKNYTGRFLVRLGIRVRPLLFGSLSDEKTRLITSPIQFTIHGFPDWFDDFADEVMHSDRGTLWFAHFMVPRNPYLLTGTCKRTEMRKRPGWWYDPDRDQLDEKRKTKLGYYYAQVRCVFSKLEELLERIGRSERHRDALILVHGDHGSRISKGIYAEEALSERDLIDNYATFFAVRAPDRVVAGHDCESASLSDLFVRYAKHTHGDAVTVPEHKTVFIPTGLSKSARVERPMPEFACFHQGPNQ